MNNSVIIQLDAEVRIFYLLIFHFLYLFYFWIVAKSNHFENYVVHAFDFFQYYQYVISLFQTRKSQRMLAFFSKHMSTIFWLKVLTFSQVFYVCKIITIYYWNRNSFLTIIISLKPNILHFVKLSYNIDVLIFVSLFSK